MSAETKVILTADQAIGLLNDGEYIHNIAGGGMIMMGCDYTRAEAAEALHNAHEIEIGGPGCKRLKHPLVVWATKNKHSFFEADMEKVAAFESALIKVGAGECR